MNEISLCLPGWGTARANVESVAALRKKIPSWAPKDTPGHFLKHADEQTVLAVAAVDQAIGSSAIDPAEFRQWAIVAAPRFIGRFAGITTLDRFTRGGGPAISPHLIPQHSLHSISGALSVLLQSRQPNCGVGGTGNSLTEALLAALTFPTTACRGIWVVATAWDPEPQFGDDGQCLNSPICHAVALPLQASIQAGGCGALRLQAGSPGADKSFIASDADHAAALCRALDAIIPGTPARRFVWPLSFGGSIVLEARAHVARLGAAA